MKIVFIGTVEIGKRCLNQVLKDGWNVQAVFTLAKRYAKTTSGFVDFGPVAKKHKIAIYRVKDINSNDSIEKIRAVEPDLIIICGWQALVCKEILDIPRLGAIGFHSSILPRYRGRAPVNWAIINGERRTGVTMFYCDPEADTGDIIAQKSFPINLMDTCATIYDKSAAAASVLIHKYLPRIKDGTVKRIKNVSYKAKFWPKRSPEDGRIDWNKSATDLHNWIRALTRPYPGAFTYYEKNKCFVWSSSPARGQAGKGNDPGKIIMAGRKNGERAVLVATADKPIWVSDITGESGRRKIDFKVGGKFY